mmetsp:Transcript_43823/g.49724  ORF Transcript_43823/g.49724 Transcript_43823/m.49724 type:complete len:84 (+) Transcript_43823:337-588(+)
MGDNNNVGVDNRIGEGLLMNNGGGGIAPDITVVYSVDEPGSVMARFLILIVDLVLLIGDGDAGDKGGLFLLLMILILLLMVSI